MNVCYCCSSGCNCNEVGDWYHVCAVSHDCFSLTFEWSATIWGYSVCKASCPSDDFLSNLRSIILSLTGNVSGTIQCWWQRPVLHENLTIVDHDCFWFCQRMLNHEKYFEQTLIPSSAHWYIYSICWNELFGTSGTVLNQISTTTRRGVRVV